MTDTIKISRELEAARGLLRHASTVLGSQGWDALTHEIDTLLTATPAPKVQAEQGERQEAFVWMRPDGDGFFELTSEGDYLSFPLYRAPQSGPDVRSLLSADDVRDACANAVSVFAEETTADQCREVAEYMREVLLAQIARRQEQPQ